MQIYCCTCKKKTDNVGAHVVQTKNGRFQLACTCAVDKTQKRGFIPASMVVKRGDGIFDFLGKDVGGFLNRIGNTALDVAIPVGAKLLGARLGAM